MSVVVVGSIVVEHFFFRQIFSGQNMDMNTRI